MPDGCRPHEPRPGDCPLEHGRNDSSTDDAARSGSSKADPGVPGVPQLAEHRVVDSRDAGSAHALRAWGRAPAGESNPVAAGFRILPPGRLICILHRTTRWRLFAILRVGWRPGELLEGPGGV